MAEEGGGQTQAPAPPAVDGWAAHEEAQRRAWQRTTARERLAWLEDAKRFAARARVAASRSSEDGKTGV